MARFSAANAKEMAARSHLLRKQRVQELRLAANPVPLPADDSYVERRLSRVRQQIEVLSDMLESESDPQKIDRLASAIARLAEYERQLANRPLPGSRRPAPERVAKPQFRIEPLPDEPPVNTEQA